MNIILSILLTICFSSFVVAAEETNKTQPKSVTEDARKGAQGNASTQPQVTNPAPNSAPQRPPAPNSTQQTPPQLNDAAIKEKAIKEQDYRCIKDIVALRNLEESKFNDEAHMSLLMYSGKHTLFQDTLVALIGMEFCVRNNKPLSDPLHQALHDLIKGDSTKDLCMRLRSLNIQYTHAAETLGDQQSWGQTLDGFQAPVGVLAGAGLFTLYTKFAK